LLLAGCAHSQPSGYGVALFGDTPYTESEVERLDRLIDDLNAEHVEIVVHLGDIGSARNACNDEWLDARKTQLARIRHPLVVVPGDNEWTDCKDQEARLAAWRTRFCITPFPVETQRGEYCEHRRWQAAGLLFVTLNVPGTSNNRRDPAERARRMKAVLAWIDESAALAERGGLTLLLLMQADPFVTVPEDGFAELRNRIKALGSRMPGKVVLAHGDTHIYRDDEPWPGVRRIEVWGSPFVSFVSAGVERGAIGFTSPRHR
jgi:hypothetical protein